MNKLTHLPTLCTLTRGKVLVHWLQSNETNDGLVALHSRIQHHSPFVQPSCRCGPNFKAAELNSDTEGQIRLGMQPEGERKACGQSETAAALPEL
jgi:hypothetical protein